MASGVAVGAIGLEFRALAFLRRSFLFPSSLLKCMVVGLGFRAGRSSSALGLHPHRHISGRGGDLLGNDLCFGFNVCVCLCTYACLLACKRTCVRVLQLVRAYVRARVCGKKVTSPTNGIFSQNYIVNYVDL